MSPQATTARCQATLTALAQNPQFRQEAEAKFAQFVEQCRQEHHAGQAGLPPHQVKAFSFDAIAPSSMSDFFTNQLLPLALKYVATAAEQEIMPVLTAALTAIHAQHPTVDLSGIAAAIQAFFEMLGAPAAPKPVPAPSPAS